MSATVSVAASAVPPSSSDPHALAARPKASTTAASATPRDRWVLFTGDSISACCWGDLAVLSAAGRWRGAVRAPWRGSSRCVRGSGASKTWATVPDSTMSPSSMNTTVSATSRAKPVSWVTTIIVVPASASACITSRTSLTSSGSSALVGSSNSITLGSIASAGRWRRAAADRPTGGAGSRRRGRRARPWRGNSRASSSACAARLAAAPIEAPRRRSPAR